MVGAIARDRAEPSGYGPAAAPGPRSLVRLLRPPPAAASRRGRKGARELTATAAAGGVAACVGRHATLPPHAGLFRGREGAHCAAKRRLLTLCAGRGGLARPVARAKNTLCAGSVRQARAGPPHAAIS